MDEELLELCESVGERTGWGNDGDLSMWCWVAAHEEYEVDNGTVLDQEHPPFPLYTSDYLLEKLPYRLAGKNYSGGKGRLSLNLCKRKGYWLACYPSTKFQSDSDTSLKALLKLTLALHAAGELK